MTNRPASTKQGKRVGLAVMALVLIAAAAMIWLVTHSSPPQTSVDTAGRYRLVDSTGKMFDRASLKGHPYVTYFGYTHCPDICPTMLTRLAKARRMLGKDGQDLRIVFITIDPQRDTQERLASFVAHVGGPVIALTGSPDTINAVADSAAIFVRRIPQPDGSYMIEHTTSALIYDRDGDFFDTVLPSDAGEAVMAKLRGVALSPMAGASGAPTQAGR